MLFLDKTKFSTLGVLNPISQMPSIMGRFPQHTVEPNFFLYDNPLYIRDKIQIWMEYGVFVGAIDGSTTWSITFVRYFL